MAEVGVVRSAEPGPTHGRGNTAATADRLLDAADPEEYSINFLRGGAFTVRVRISGTTGEASDTSKARAITHAVARALGLEVDPCPK